MRRTRVTSEKQTGDSISGQGGGRARASCICPAAPLLTLQFPEPGIKFAAVFLSFGTVACPRGTWLAPDTMVVRTSPTIGQLAWVQQLERPYSFHVENSDCCIVVCQHSDRPHILDEESASLQRRADDAYLALTLMCGPTGSQVLCITGGNDGGVVHVPQLYRCDDYLPACGLQPAGWTPQSMRNASSVYAALGNLRGHSRFNRGVNCLVEALHTHGVCHRLHSHVRAIEALIPLEDHKGRWDFAERLCDLAAYPTWGEKCAARKPPHSHVRPYQVVGETQHLERFEDLYALRSQIEHLLDPKDARSDLADREFKRYIESECRLAERVVFGLYRRILLKPDLLSVFYDKELLTGFWDRAPEDRRSTWGIQVRADGRCSRNIGDCG